MATTTPKPRPIVIFIHGFNTFGDDEFHAGFIKLGPMYQFWKPRFEEIGAEFYSLKKMGYDLIEDQVDRAFKQVVEILSARVGRLPTDHVHLFGHSLGGLVARGVARRLRDEQPSLADLRTVITIGSPHAGGRAPEIALSLDEKSPALFRIMKAVGYDTEKRRVPFLNVRNELIADYTSRHPALEGIDNISLVGSPRRSDLGVPLAVIYHLLHPRDDRYASDGLIPASSQRWARHGGEFALDHFGQLGAHLQILPSKRRAAAREFERAVKVIQEIIRTHSKS